MTRAAYSWAKWVGRHDVEAMVLVDQVEPGLRPADVLADDGVEGVVGPEGDDEGADPAVGAEPARRRHLGGVDAEGGEHGVGGDVVVAGRLDAEQVVVPSARAAGGRPCRGVRQRVADVPAVDADVLIVDVRRRRVGPGTTLPVVLVGVDDAVQGERDAHPLEHAHVIAELVLQLAHQRLDVQRQAVERPAVARHGEPAEAEGGGDLGRPRQRRVEHGAAGDAVGQRVAHGHEPVGRIGGHGGQAWGGVAEVDTERRVGDPRRRHVGHDHVGWRVRIQHVRRQVTHRRVLRSRPGGWRPSEAAGPPPRGEFR